MSRAGGFSPRFTRSVEISARHAKLSDDLIADSEAFRLAILGLEAHEDDYTRPFVTIEPWEAPERDWTPCRSPSPAELAQRSRDDPPKPQGHHFGGDLLCTSCGDVSWTQHQREPTECSRRAAIAKAADPVRQERKQRVKELAEIRRQSAIAEHQRRLEDQRRWQENAKKRAYPLTLRQRALQNMIELAIWDAVGAPGLRFHVDLRKQREQCKPTTNEEKHQ